jgi:hypothetical protein
MAGTAAFRRERAIDCLRAAVQLAVLEGKGLREDTSRARAEYLEEAVDELMLAVAMVHEETEHKGG